MTKIEIKNIDFSYSMGEGSTDKDQQVALKKGNKVFFTSAQQNCKRYCKEYCYIRENYPTHQPKQGETFELILDLRSEC